MQFRVGNDSVAYVLHWYVHFLHCVPWKGESVEPFLGCPERTKGWLLSKIARRTKVKQLEMSHFKRDLHDMGYKKGTFLGD